MTKVEEYCKRCGYFDKSKKSFYKCCGKVACPAFNQERKKEQR